MLCSFYGAEMRIVAFIVELSSLRRILQHLGCERQPAAPLVAFLQPGRDSPTAPTSLGSVGSYTPRLDGSAGGYDLRRYDSAILAKVIRTGKLGAGLWRQARGFGSRSGSVAPARHRKCPPSTPVSTAMPARPEADFLHRLSGFILEVCPVADFDTGRIQSICVSQYYYLS